MSASFALPEQIDGLEKLLALANLRPENIIATQKVAREQLQLTQEDQGKLAAAKAYIAKHTSLVAELQAREEALAASKASHIKNVQEHAAHVASENTRLETFSASLSARQKQQEEIDKRQRAEAERLAGLSVDMERQHREAMSSVQQQQVSNNSIAKANEIESERLKNWESTLKKKAQSLREQAANF